MLNYNVYKNISDDEFISMEKRLSVLEAKIGHIVVPLKWEPTMLVEENDTLVIDYVLDQDGYNGNLGIVFDDLRSKMTFSFYLTKSYGERKKRWFTRKFLYTHRALSFYEKNIEDVVSEAILIYNTWDKEYIFKNELDT